MMIVFRVEKIVDGIDQPDPELEQELERLLGDISAFLTRVYKEVAEVIAGEVEPLDFLGVRIVASGNPKMGHAFKWFKQKRKFPSIIVGYGGNVAEFENTLIHEILHFSEWDEYILEKKTEEIISRRLP